MQRTICGITGLLFFMLIFSCSKGPSETCLIKRTDDIDISGGPAMMGYEDFLARIERIGIGSKKADVESMLGEPESRSETIWSYDLRNRRGFPGIPPATGTTVFIGIDIIFEEGQVKDISRSWMDATGPAP